MKTPEPTATDLSDTETPEPAAPACVMSFNASDPSGAGGLAGDVATIAAMGAHALPVVTAIVLRDTAEVFESPLRRELQNAGFPVINGAIALPECAGIGYQLPPDILDRFRI